MNEYEAQAEKFLKETNTEFKAEFLKHDKHFIDDKETRDIYEITLKRRGRSFKFNFGQCTAESSFKIINTNTNKEVRYTWFNEMTFNKDRDRIKLNRDILKIFGGWGCFKLVVGKSPNAYDVLACLTTSEVGTFKDFCDEYGYNEDSRKAEQIYNDVLNEWNNLKMLYTEEELLKLSEI